MKKISLILFAIFLSALSFGQKEDATTKNTRIDVYYFHRTERCQTCLSIEENTKATLEAYFSDEVEDGTITFRSINFEGDADTDLIEKYSADGPSLFLTRVKNGKEKTKNLSDFAMENSLYNPDKFKRGLRDDLNKLLR